MEFKKERGRKFNYLKWTLQPLSCCVVFLIHATDNNKRKRLSCKKKTSKWERERERYREMLL